MLIHNHLTLTSVNKLSFYLYTYYLTAHHCICAGDKWTDTLTNYFDFTDYAFVHLFHHLF